MADAVVVETHGADAVVTTSDWRAGLPEDLRADKTLATVKDIPSLAKMVVEGQKLVGNSVRMPAAGSTPEQVAAWKAENLPKLRGAGMLDGPPDSPDKYAIQRPEGAMDGGWSEESEKGFLTASHAAGLSQTQTQAVMNFYGQMIAGQRVAAQADAQRVEAELRTTWGPNYDANLGRANRAIQEFGGQELIDLFAETGMGRHPTVIKAFVALGNAMVEHGALAPGGTPGITPADATAKIAAIRADKKHAFNNGSHVDHEAALADVLALRRVITGADNRVLTEIP